MTDLVQVTRDPTPHHITSFHQSPFSPSLYLSLPLSFPPPHLSTPPPKKTPPLKIKLNPSNLIHLFYLPDSVIICDGYPCSCPCPARKLPSNQTMGIGMGIGINGWAGRIEYWTYFNVRIRKRKTEGRDGGTEGGTEVVNVKQ